MKRNNRIVLLDPVDEVVYSRRARKGSQYREDPELQVLYWDKGRVALKQYAMRSCQGYSEAVLP